MKPSKLLRHFNSCHKELIGKDFTYFEHKRDQYLEQTKRLKKSLSVNDKALEASYHISLRISQSKKAHTTGEKLILPSIIDTIRIFFGEEKVKEIEKIPLSKNTVKRRIDDMISDVEKQMNNRINESIAFSLQLDESADIAKKLNYLFTFITYLTLNYAKKFFSAKKLLVIQQGKSFLVYLINTLLRT